MDKRMNPMKNITRFTYEFSSFQGWRLSVCRHHMHYTRYFSDREYGSAEESLQAALIERDRVYEYLATYRFEPKKALELCIEENRKRTMPCGLHPRRIRKPGER